MWKIKIVFISICVVFFAGFSFAKSSDYLEYADIPWTDVINFNWQVNGITYEVWVDTWQIDYVTWSDNKVHVCFPIIWTWYTNKLWEIYFQYDTYGSYVCDDYKLRWVFKIWAGWRWHMEDLEYNPEKWKCFLDKTLIDGYYYHSNWSNWTWQVWLDDIWFANFNTVKTALNLSNVFSSVKILIQFNFEDLVANWVSTWEMLMKILYPNPSNPISPYVLKNFTLSSVEFLTGFNSDVKRNWYIYPGFKYVWWLTTNENGVVSWSIIAYHPGENLTYWIKITIWSWKIISTWTIFKKILPPFLTNLLIFPKEVLGKKLIWYKNVAKIAVNSDPNITSLSFLNTQTKLNLWSYADYFKVITGDNIWFNKYKNLQIDYNLSKFYPYDSLKLNYNYITSYSFKQGSNSYYISSYSGQTTYDNLYKYWLVKKIVLVPDSSNVLADGKQAFWYKVRFLNSQNYPVNNLRFSLDFSDPEKYFNLSSGNSYVKWYFLITWDSKADINWIYNIWVISYKPISKKLSAYLTGWIKNICYSWNYSISSPDFYEVLNDLYFLNVTSLSLEDKIININKETTIHISYTKNSSNVSNWKFLLTGYLLDCSSCKFEKWKILSWNSFLSNDYTIYITGWSDPQQLIYSGFIWYDLAWNYWTKKVRLSFKKIYKDFLFIWWWTLQIVWNILTNRKILWWLSYVSTIVNPSVFRNKLRKDLYVQVIRWRKKNIINTNISMYLDNFTWDIYVYKCSSPNIVVSLKGNYSWNKKIYFINCQLNIDWDILKNWIWKLSIISFAPNENNYVDFDSNDWWLIPWNIYIWSSVKTIQANLITNGSILTYTWNFLLNSNKFFYLSRWSDDWLRKQLFIQWKVFAKNTIWWGLQNTKNEYTLIWWRKVPNNWQWFDGKTASEIAKAYDMKFWRSSFVKSDWSYDTGDLSQLIYNKYHCTWNVSTDTSKFCNSTIVIVDSNNF